MSQEETCKVTKLTSDFNGKLMKKYPELDIFTIIFRKADLPKEYKSLIKKHVRRKYG